MTLLNVQFITIVYSMAINPCQVIINARLKSDGFQSGIVFAREFVRTYNDVIHLVYVV
jgi:hypothetical protein